MLFETVRIRVEISDFYEWKVMIWYCRQPLLDWSEKTPHRGFPTRRLSSIRRRRWRYRKTDFDCGRSDKGRSVLERRRYQYAQNRTSWPGRIESDAHRERASRQYLRSRSWLRGEINLLCPVKEILVRENTGSCYRWSCRRQPTRLYFGSIQDVIITKGNARGG